MNSKFLIGGIVAAAAIGAACSTTTLNTNTNINTNSNVAILVDANNMPPGLSASPIAPSANTTPGIPAPGAANAIPKGTTPTPGIPDPKTLRKPMKPGVTPTPGIPDPATLRRQMQQPGTNVNTPSPGNNDMLMRGRKSPRPVNRPQ